VTIIGARPTAVLRLFLASAADAASANPEIGLICSTRPGVCYIISHSSLSPCRLRVTAARY